jgi:hypothetical protein
MQGQGPQILASDRKHVESVKLHLVVMLARSQRLEIADPARAAAGRSRLFSEGDGTALFLVVWLMTTQRCFDVILAGRSGGSLGTAQRLL